MVCALKRFRHEILIVNAKTVVLMKTFIEDYLLNPSLAVANARMDAAPWCESVDEEMIYAQISSPEFRLYEAMIFCPSVEDSPSARTFASL